MTSTITTLAMLGKKGRRSEEDEGKSRVGKFGRELRREFLFDDGYLNLNHGESVNSMSRKKMQNK